MPCVQITHAGLNKDNEAELLMEEMPVTSVGLAFSDRESRKPIPKGKTKPHVLTRELSMRPGKVLFQALLRAVTEVWQPACPPALCVCGLPASCQLVGGTEIHND